MKTILENTTVEILSFCQFLRHIFNHKDEAKQQGVHIQKFRNLPCKPRTAAGSFLDPYQHNNEALCRAESIYFLKFKNNELQPWRGSVKII